MLKFLGTLFGHVAAGAAHVWDQAMNKNVFPALGVVAHAAVGFVVGPLATSVYTAVTTGTPMTVPGLLPVVLGTTLGALVGLGNASPLAIINKLAATLTPAEQANIVQALSTKIAAALPPSKAPAATPPSAGSSAPPPAAAPPSGSGVKQ